MPGGTTALTFEFREKGINKVASKMNAQLGSQINQLEKALGSLDKKNIKVTQSFKKLDKGMYAGFQTISAGAKQGILSMKLLQTFVGQIAHYISFTIGVQMVMGIRRGLESAISTFREFEKAVTNAAAISGYLGAAFDEARDSIAMLSIELGQRTIFTANQVAKAMYDLASAGYQVVGMSEDELIPILEYAAATQTSLEEATKAVVTSLKQFNLQLEDSSEVVDTWTALITNSFATMEKLREGMKYAGTIAGTLGQDYRDVSAALAVLNNRGMEGSQAGQRLNMIFTKLLKPTDKAVVMLDEMGLTLSDISPATKSLTEILYTLQEANFGTAESATMFRARTAAAAATLVQSADEVADYVTLSKEMQGITTEIAEKQMGTLDGALKQLDASFNEMSITLGSKLAPGIKAISSALDGLGAIIGPVVDRIGELYEVATFKILDRFFPDKDEVEERGKSLNKAIEEAIEYTGEGTTIFEKFSDTINEFSDVLSKYVGIREELTELEQQGLQDTPAYIDKQKELIEINKEMAESENQVIKSSGLALNILKQTSSEVDKAMSHYGSYIQAQGKLAIEESKRNKLLEEQEVLSTKLAITAANLGVNSKTYNKILGDYVDVSSRLDRTNEEIINQNEKLIESNNDYSDSLENMNDHQREVIDLATQLIDVRSDLFEAQSEYDKLLAKLNKLTRIQGNYQGYLEEALRNVTESEYKLFEIELKRKKLQEDRLSDMDDLFQALAEQGMLTDDIIDAYIDEEKAQGEVLKSGVAFAGVLNDLTQEQRDVVTDWVQAYVDSGGDISAANASIGGSLKSLVGISESAFSTVLEYAGALYIAGQAADNLEGIIVPYTEDLVENNLASQGLIKTLGDLEETLYELEKSIAAPEDEINEFTDSIFNLMDIVATGMIAELPIAGIDFDLVAPDDAMGPLVEGAMRATPAMNAFEQSLFELNQNTGWFADRTATSQQVLQAYTNFMQNQGVAAQQMFTGAALTTAATLIEAAGSTENVTALTDSWGKSISELIPYGQVAFETLEGGVDTTKTKLGEANDEVAYLQSQLDILTAKAYDVEIKIHVKMPDILGGIGDFFAGFNKWQFAKGTIATKPTMGIIGEAGPEAVVPLTGSNKMQGRRILDYIIPKYYPELMGGGYPGMASTMPVYAGAGGDTFTETYNILGPVTVKSDRPDKFMKELQMRYRTASPTRRR